MQLRQRYLDTNARAIGLGEALWRAAQRRHQPAERGSAASAIHARRAEADPADLPERLRDREVAGGRRCRRLCRRSSSGPANRAIAQVKLRELESIAQTDARALRQFRSASDAGRAEPDAFPITDARVITNAAPPDGTATRRSRSSSRSALAAGLGAGVGIAFVRELLNRSIRNKRQLEKASGVPCLGLLPTIKTGAMRTKAERPASRAPRALPKRSELTFVCRAPFSQFAEGIRAIKLSADLSLARRWRCRSRGRLLAAGRGQEHGLLKPRVPDGSDRKPRAPDRLRHAQSVAHVGPRTAGGDRPAPDPVPDAEQHRGADLDAMRRPACTSCPPQPQGGSRQHEQPPELARAWTSS